MTKCYIRFGNIPDNEISKVYRGDATIKEEAGVSVWDCTFADDVPYPMLPPNPSKDAVSDYFYHIFGDRPVYLVTGDELIEKGSDGEPLLKDVTIIREYTKDYAYLKGILRSDDQAAVTANDSVTACSETK